MIYMLRSISVIVAILYCMITCGCAPTTSFKHDRISAYNPQYNIFTSHIAKPYRNELDNGKDGGIIISDGTSALLHRLAFVQLAQESIDIQTYIYKNELTSRLLVYELLKAADRGVRIRILIDDNGISSNVKDIALLDNHKNIEVRIFNPYFARFSAFRVFEALFDFSRINRRMHNKLFIFDNTALIVGGRNIADEYFDNGEVNFTDTDVLFLGNMAKDARVNFEKFWDYKRSIPSRLFTLNKAPKNYKSIEELYKINPHEWHEYTQDIESFKKKYMHKEFKVAWGKGIFLADLPNKIDMNERAIKTPILDLLMYNLNLARDSIVISSSYLVPGDAILDIWREFINRGIKLSIFTNSLASIDVVPVYSHWEHYRDRLARIGASVYEYPSKEAKSKLKDKTKFYRSTRGKVSLHSKNMIIDQKIVAVGSFNLDYRSSMLNTESIVFFKSEELAKELLAITHEQMQDSYHIVCYEKSKKCKWELVDDNGLHVFDVSPNTSIWLRFYKSLLRIIPQKLL